MAILKANGELLVSVDAVELEQIGIQHPRMVEGFPIGLRAMCAAFMSEDVLAYQRELYKCGHTLEYVSSDAVGDEFLVKLKVRVKNAAERVDANAE